MKVSIMWAKWKNEKEKKKIITQIKMRRKEKKTVEQFKKMIIL